MSQSGLTPLKTTHKLVLEVYELASIARRRGKSRTLRDTTILFPIDSILIEAVTIALKHISSGGLDFNQDDIEDYLQPVLNDPEQRQQFEIALAALRERLSN